jgi:hypothetical protein
MNISSRSDPTNGKRTIQIHIVDVVEQKEGGYTVVVQPHSNSEITSEEIWRTALPGDFRGATRVDRLWHLYYAQDPGYLPDSWRDIVLPDEAEEGTIG